MHTRYPARPGSLGSSWLPAAELYRLLGTSADGRSGDRHASVAGVQLVSEGVNLTDA